MEESEEQLLRDENENEVASGEEESPEEESPEEEKEESPKQVSQTSFLAVNTKWNDIR